MCCGHRTWVLHIGNMKAYKRSEKNQLFWSWPRNRITIRLCSNKDRDKPIGQNTRSEQDYQGPHQFELIVWFYLSRGFELEPLTEIIVGRKGGKGGDGDWGGAHPAAPLDHLVDRGGVAGEEGLDGAVPSVADRTVEADLPGGLDRPISKEHPLKPPLDHHPELEGNPTISEIRREEESGTKKRTQGGRIKFWWTESSAAGLQLRRQRSWAIRGEKIRQRETERGRGWQNK